MTTVDLRGQAFYSNRLPACFHPIIQESEIWRRDPFDVDILHQHARERFAALLQTLNARDATTGRIWLIRGESGAGKTHLMRAFRNHLHDSGAGMFSYMQMTAGETSYPRYMLNNTLDSLSKPYRDGAIADRSGLIRLSDALTSLPAVAELPALRECREAPELDDDELAERVFAIADCLGALPELAEVELGLLRAFVYLQRDDHRVRRRIMSLLRCEAMPPADQRVIGGLTPYLHDDDPARLLSGLCRLVTVTDSGTLVICLDQLENVYCDVNDETGVRFRAAVQAVLSLVSRTPRLLVVVSCLSDYYQVLRQQLSRSDLDRIEHDPEPCDIVTQLDAPTIRLLIETRLQALYEYCEVGSDPAEPLWPLSSDWVDVLAGLSAREVLTRCQQARDQVDRNDSLAGDAHPPSPDSMASSDLLRWKQRWNDHLAGDTPTLPDDDAAQLELLLSALHHAAGELPDRAPLRCQVLPGVNPCMSALDDAVQGERVIALCNKTAIGGALARQLLAAETRAGGRRLLLVRSTEFPRNVKTRIVQQLAELVSRKDARRVLVEDADWRAMAAMRTFRAQHADAPGFHAWLQADRPLTILPALRGLLDLDRDDDTSSSCRSGDVAAPAATLSTADSSPSRPLDRSRGARCAGAE